MAGDAMAPLRAIADALAARGVRRVTGAIVPGADAFPDATLGFGWSYDDLDFPYAAGVDELYFNEGFSRVLVKGGAAEGDAVTVRTMPALTLPRVRASVRTIARPAVPPTARRPRTVTVRQDSADAATIIVDGTIVAGDSAILSITHRDPARAFLLALHEALRAKGIVVEDGVSPWRGTATYPLFSMMSPTLAEILPAFEKPSQNQIGEILLRALGRARAGAGSADSGARVVRDQLLAWGAARDGFVVRDGSGLSRQNVITPETLIRVLDAMRQSPSFPVFYDALPIAGVDGTIANRMKGTPGERNVHAKTGTLDMVRSLSGYVTTADGRQLLFSVLCNNWTVPVREVERVQDALAVHLASMRLGGR
jgi:D-alanyl-D-alanine carboxypeptidase/D-alanyl-D-alanine-endopeptidase (penicillin-binding protein 4)